MFVLETLLSYQRSPSVAAPVSVVALAVKLRFLKLLYVPAVILMFAEPYPETLPSAILISLPVLVVKVILPPSLDADTVFAKVVTALAPDSAV